MSVSESELQGIVGPIGELAMEVIPATPRVDKPLTVAQIKRYGFPRAGLSDAVNEWRSENVVRKPFLSGMKDALIGSKLASLFGLAHIEGTLFGKIIRANGEVVDLGLMGLNIVTTAGVNYIGDSFRNTVEPEAMKYHGIGTGATAEVVGNTALGTEATTQYNPDNTRATGSLAGTNNVFTTVGTNTVDASFSPTEWGLFTQAATGGGTMLDRVTFTAVALANGDSLQTTFNLTFTSGG